MSKHNFLIHDYFFAKSLDKLRPGGVMALVTSKGTMDKENSATPVASVDTASEALAVSMGEKARVDMEYMCELTGKSEEEIYQDLKGVIFLNPMHGYGNSDEAKYLMADEYLSGNVREKLAWAKRSAEVYPDDYKINVEALEKVQPTDLTASEIFVQLGTTWLPEEIVQQFIYEFLDTPMWARWNIKVH